MGIFLIPFKCKVIYYLFSKRRATQHCLIQWGCSQTQQEGDNSLFSAFSHLSVTVDIQAGPPMTMLKVAESCFKAGPAHGFGLLLFLHQPPSYKTFISVVGCLFPPQGSSAKSRYSLSQDLRWWADLLVWAPLPASILHQELATAWGVLLFLTRLLVVPAAQKLCC